MAAVSVSWREEREEWSLSCYIWWSVLSEEDRVVDIVRGRAVGIGDLLAV